MRILIINKFLYPRGGDCICSLNLRRLLETKRHEVRFFAMNFPENISYPEASYFAERISFTEGGIKDKVAATMRIVFGTGIKNNFERLLADFEPDIIHLHNIHSYLSPIVAQLAHRKGIKVVWTLHDYKLICPSYSCLYRGEICEACFADKHFVVTKKCMKNDLIASMLAWGEGVWWNSKRVCKWVDCFICPSQFMANKMTIGGFPKEKLKVFCNFIDDEKLNLIHSIDAEKQEAYCYVGRLSGEKGVEALLTIAITLPYTLYIVGDGPQADELREKFNAPHIHFMGQQTNKEVITVLKTVCFSVLPSAWYENNPLSIIESLCCGTPVLGSRLGGIPELLTDQYSELFTWNNAEELKAKIIIMFNKCKKIDNEQLSQSSISRFQCDEYYDNIMNIYLSNEK